MVLGVALILDYLQVQNLGFQIVKKEGHVPALLRKYKSQEPEFDCLRANEEETGFTAQGINSKHRFTTKKIPNTQEDPEGRSRAGPARLLQILKDNLDIMSLSGQSYRGLEWCV